ncbi:MAG: hypothetical protein AAGA80_13905 [Cyanobacteria bacterium P01_F01_bin.143]
MSSEKSEPDLNKLEKEANKLKALAQLYSYLEMIETGFEKLQKESGKLMLAENANENFEAYYKFVLPISKELIHIRNIAKLSRSELRKYQGLSNSDIFSGSSNKRKKADRKTKEISKSNTVFGQLERRVEELEFYFRLILSLLIVVFVTLTILLMSIPNS